MLKSDVIEFFGTQRAVAMAVGVTPPAVSQWREIIPELKARKLDGRSNGIRKLKFRPELYERRA